MMKLKTFTFLLTCLTFFSLQANDFIQYVNPFIGTTNYGATNPGAVCPNGMMSVSPFNVMGSKQNKFDKDARWWSTPYEKRNSYFTGYSHVNLSGVGCPDLASLLLMPTTGTLEFAYQKYGTTYSKEIATPGYYSNFLNKYKIRTEVTATPRTSMARFYFPKGKSHLLLNLGEGLTNESGAFLRKVNDREVEGMKLLGTFCYHAEAVFPIYFVMRVSKQPVTTGYWKKQRMMGVEANWDKNSGTYKNYTTYTRELAGDDIGAYFSFDTEEDEAIEVRLGVSFVSVANARENLDKEQGNQSFATLLKKAQQAWNKELGKIEVEGGTKAQKTVFYTALYHALLHPNILQDVNGEYPEMETGQIATSKGNEYTVFSLWDTYRNLHQLLTLVYPQKQLGMIRSMVQKYKEFGWLPKWELYGRETFTMEGDPSIPVIVDSWLKGLTDFDVSAAYEAMYKSATTRGAENKLRPDNDDYLSLGYVALRSQYDNSVSHALEYYVADHALSLFAEKLGKKEDAQLFRGRSLNYKKYFSKRFGTLRPLLPNGCFLKDFDPSLGANFEPVPGFHEGSAWNYTFFVPHDIKGLAKLMGGKKAFVKNLQMVFDKGYYDPANEPDIAYPYLFSYFKGEAWRTQKIVKELLAKEFQNKPSGIPGNDDTGVMSCWAVFSMMGFYPDCPGVPEYTLTTPTFDKITIHLDTHFYPKDKLIITKEVDQGSSKNAYRIKYIKIKKKRKKGFRITHEELINAGELKFRVK